MVQVHSEGLPSFRIPMFFLASSWSFWRATTIENTNVVTGFHIVRVHFEGHLQFRIPVFFNRFYMVRVHSELLLSFKIPIFFFVSSWWEVILKGHCQSEYQCCYSFLHCASSFWRATIIQNYKRLSCLHKMSSFSRATIIQKTKLQTSSSFLHGTSSIWRATVILNNKLFSRFYMRWVHSEGLISFRIPIFLLVFIWCKLFLNGY